MEEISLKILEKTPELNTWVKVIIEPLAPLSMVNELPGSYYKTLKVPSKKMLCGLFENLLGWHIDIADRKKILSELITFRQKEVKGKEAKANIKDNLNSVVKGSTFVPLLMEYFDIEPPTTPPMMHYDDLWSKAYRRSDADVHPKGTMNLSYELIPEKRNRKRDEKNPKQIASSELMSLFKDNIGGFPIYYSSPTTREYINVYEPYQITMAMEDDLYRMLNNSLSKNNMLYVGNSEGWINLKLEKL